MTVFNIITLLGGLALFLYGMRIMGDGLKKGSSGALKKAMEKVTNNAFVGFLLGLTVTAVIQSSTATIVLTSGLVAAGVISLHQSLGIIIGANVGTTVTGQIIRLLDINSSATSWLNFFKPDTLAPIAAVIGILLIMAFKFYSSDNIGTIAMGFAILFTGLLNMTAAVEPLKNSESFAQLFLTLAEKPALGFVAGTVVAFILQSSSATVGILQAFATTGKLSLASIYTVLIGIYLGDCITTAIVCSIGTKADAKRTGVIHILFNLCSAVLVLVAVSLLRRFGVFSVDLWTRPFSSGDIANTNTLFKLGSAFLLLPGCVLFEKLSLILIRDDKKKEKHADAELKLLDEALFSSPALALSGAHKVICSMGNLACSGVSTALDCVLNYDQKTVNAINENEADIDAMADRVSDYLIRFSPSAPAGNANDHLNYYMKIVAEYERIGDYVVNLTENAAELRGKTSGLTDSALKELQVVRGALEEIIRYTQKAFVDEDKEAAFRVEPVEEVIDDLVSTLRTNHIVRLRRGECNVVSGFPFLDILTNVERIADQCSNIGVYTVVLLDGKIADMQHDYIRHLHQGRNEEFNREYREVHDRYFTALPAVAQK